MGGCRVLIVGSVYKYEGRLWRCGLVNFSRARLDPISAVAQANILSGRTFSTYGQSVNITCTAELPEVDIATLDEWDLRRLCNLIEREDAQVAKTASLPTGGEGGGMTETKGERLKRLNAERKLTLAQNEQVRAKVAALGPPKAASSGGGSTNKGPQPKDKQCKCGCGQATAGWFFPGHDARFKGWLLKIERGLAKPEDLLTPEVRASYTWRKTEKGGLMPTTNYRGEPHFGYDK